MKKLEPSAFTQRAIATYFPGGAGENGETQHITNHAPRPSYGETLDAYADRKLRIEKRKYAKIQSVPVAPSQMVTKPKERLLQFPIPELPTPALWMSDPVSENTNLHHQEDGVGNMSDESDQQGEIDFQMIEKLKRKRKRDKQKLRKRASVNPEIPANNTSSSVSQEDKLTQNQIRKMRKKRRMKELKTQGAVGKKRRVEEESSATTFVYVPVQDSLLKEEEEDEIETSVPQEPQEDILQLGDETYRDFVLRFRQYSADTKEDEAIEFYGALLELMRNDFKKGGVKDPVEVRHVQHTERNCAKVFKLLRQRALSKQILNGLLVIKRCMVMQKFEDANQQYFHLNIGSAAWPSTAPSPIGQAMKLRALKEKAIQKKKKEEEKAAKEKKKGREEEDDEEEEEDEIEEEGASIEEEEGKQLLHAVKRLMTFFEQKVGSPFISKDEKMVKEHIAPHQQTQQLRQLESHYAN